MFFGSKKPNKENSSSFDLASQPVAGGHCLISGAISIRGDVVFAGTLRVDGRIDGRITVADGKQGMLIVSKGGIINGPVNVTDVIVDGTINGDIIAQEKVECRRNAFIRGEVHYQNINIAEGARIEGRCIKKDQKAAAQAATVPDSFLATRTVGGKK